MSDQPPSKGKDNLDDIFHPLDQDDTIPPLSTAPTSGSVPPPPPGSGYVPPPPSAQQRRPPPIMYILIGVALTLVCLCGLCAALFGLGAANIANNPTVRAGMGTLQGVVSTAATLVDLPQQLPKNNRSAGSIGAGDTQSGQLLLMKQDVWQFQGSAQKITITVSAQKGAFEPMIGLYDSGGALLAKATSPSGGNQTLTYELQSEGTYNILVAGIGGAPGSYDIKVSGGSQ